MSASPPAKRTKVDDDGVLNILSPHVLTSVDDLAKAYGESKPYRHGRVENMFEDTFLELVLQEIKQNSKVKFKESDLFRVYQSIDLGNLASDAPENITNLPSLLKLKAALYSPKYRSFVERIAHLQPGTLTDQVDCAANCHAPGCHLLCHDDVIGTRRVSYILYLTERGWTKEEGGALELYDHDVVETTNGDGDKEQQRVPQPIPCKTLLPLFNSMAYFAVEPGASFHAVQEVFGERPRLSIQGWYHAATAPQHMEEATLSQLKSRGGEDNAEGDFEVFDQSESAKTNGDHKIDPDDDDTAEATTLSKSDYNFLVQYLNETYLSPTSIKEIRERFEEDSSVQLRQFLKKEWIDLLDKERAKDDVGDDGNGTPALDYQHHVSDDWKVVGPAHKQRFLEYTGNDAKDGTSGPLLMHLKRKVFQSPPFGRFLQCITSLGMPLGYRGRVRRFRPGLDYTVAHYGILTTQPVLDATLCFCAGTGEQCRVDEETGDLLGTDADAVWASGDCGGFECYIEADDEGDDDSTGEATGKQEAADEYNDEDDTELLSVSASNNTLSLVYRDPGTMRFVKYVGCRAPSSRWDVSMEYEVEDTDEDDDGEDNNAEGADETEERESS